MAPVQPARAHAYTFTINNWCTLNIDHLRTVECSYIVWGKEIGETGTPHLQGFVRFVNAKSFAACKNLLSCGAHIEAAHHPRQAIIYCKKDGEFEEHGTPPTPGKRSDLSAFVSAESSATERITRRKLIEDHTTVMARFPRFVALVQSEYHPPGQLLELDNYWFYGPPATGKSATARQFKGDYYVKGIHKWWDGYDGEDTVIVDDLHPQQHFEFMTDLKVWADLYPFQAEVKGSMNYIRPKRIIVTSNHNIEDYCRNFCGVDREAINRRFKECKFPDENPLSFEEGQVPISSQESVVYVATVQRITAPNPEDSDSSFVDGTSEEE